MIPEPARLETERIAEQLRRSYEGPAWCGSSLKELLDDVTPELAARKPSNGGHSIWEIVRHASFWADICARTLEGQPYPPRLTPPADWPDTKGTWPDALIELEREQRRVLDALKTFRDERLTEKVTPPKGYNYYVVLHGLIQHNLYHAGQIAILKR